MRFSCAKKNLEGGFTLIEVMVVVVIVAILATIAFPSYQDSVRKAARRAAQGALLDIASRQQQFFLDNRAYASTYGSGGLNLTFPSEVNNRYTFPDPVLQAGPPPCFTITATAIGQQAVDGNLTLDCRGAKTWKGETGW
jgi:type IV pilus assembly protein PilE